MMGKIEVRFFGSFGEFRFTEAAEAGGHAAAVARVIRTLAGTYLPPAIRKDHALHEQGEHPPDAPFGEKAQPDKAAT